MVSSIFIILRVVAGVQQGLAALEFRQQENSAAGSSAWSSRKKDGLIIIEKFDFFYCIG
jgi:hypothetical protein